MKRVLVVDDDMAVQRHCRDILETEGFEVFCESSLGSTRRYLRHNKADTILLDLFLPDGCGYELFRTSADLIEGVPVVAMTAVYQGSANARLLSLRHPFRSVLSKPIHVAALVEALRGIFEDAYPDPPDWARSHDDEATVVAILSEEVMQAAVADPPEMPIVHESPAANTSFSTMPSVGDFVSPLDPRGSAFASAGEPVRSVLEASTDAMGWDPTSPEKVDPGASSSQIEPVEVAPEVEAPAEKAPSKTPDIRTNPNQRNGIPSDRITSPVRRRTSRELPSISRRQPVIQRRMPLERTVNTRYPMPEAEPEVSSESEYRLNPRNPDSEGLLVPQSLDPRRAPLQGRLTETPFPAILTRLARSRGTGSLLLRRDKVKKIVFIDNGVPVAVKSNLLYECLGQILVRENLITEASCEISVERLKTEKRLQGDILTEMGVIAPRSLDGALELQFDTKFRDIFTWSQGLYQYRTTSLGEIHPIAARDPFTMILDGLRSGFPADRISIDLSPFMTQAPTLLVTRSDLKSLDLTEPERDWLRLLDNRRSLGNILNVTGGAEGVYRLFYGLVCLGLLAFRPRELSYAPSL